MNNDIFAKHPLPWYAQTRGIIGLICDANGRPVDLYKHAQDIVAIVNATKPPVAEGQDDLESLLDLYSDMYKDRYGVRPRHIFVEGAQGRWKDANYVRLQIEELGDLPVDNDF